jgi:hypothetical protein
VAFDAVHTLRYAKRLSRRRLKTLAALLDFGACANAAFDNKGYCEGEYRQTLQLLEKAGIGASVADYLGRLENLESNRPSPGDDHWDFHGARLYREAVVRLSLGVVSTTANVHGRLDDAIQATWRDPHLDVLFRIVMQCQIIDDVLDYAKDAAAGLPGFLTASPSLAQAFELSRLAVFRYADCRDAPQTDDLLPFRVALRLASNCARLMLLIQPAFCEGFGRQRQWRPQTAPERSGNSSTTMAITRP